MSSLANLPLVPLQNGGGGSALGIVFSLVAIAIVLLTIAGTWKTFQKANEPGWAAIVPIYNFYIMIKIGGNAWWWLIVFFIPLVNIVPAIKIPIDVAKAFGQGIGFGLGLGFLSFIFLPLLGFGDYEYQGVPE
ncbi:DUF5684 domain-containing protein [Halococcus agarilyticus]|uniref:DUF5684 domain-containing protein n=1 Tax=Halococcus agarilyticus TaxID=1232219 RepID=UPI001E324D73|nr:DUF5684 domain-containing protein [Halococcus agarilyticus]